MIVGWVLLIVAVGWLPNPLTSRNARSSFMNPVFAWTTLIVALVPASSTGLMIGFGQTPPQSLLPPEPVTVTSVRTPLVAEAMTVGLTMQTPAGTFTP